MAILGPFLVIIWLLHEILSQKRGSDNHFDVPNMPKSDLNQNLQLKTQSLSLPVFAIL